MDLGVWNCLWDSRAQRRFKDVDERLCWVQGMGMGMATEGTRA